MPQAPCCLETERTEHPRKVLWKITVSSYHAYRFASLRFFLHARRVAEDVDLVIGLPNQFKAFWKTCFVKHMLTYYERGKGGQRRKKGKDFVGEGGCDSVSSPISDERRLGWEGCLEWALAGE